MQDELQVKSPCDPRLTVVPRLMLEGAKRNLRRAELERLRAAEQETARVTQYKLPMPRICPVCGSSVEDADQ